MRCAILRVGSLRERPSQPGWLSGPDATALKTSSARTIVDVITSGALLVVQPCDHRSEAGALGTKGFLRKFGDGFRRGRPPWFPVSSWSPSELWFQLFVADVTWGPLISTSIGHKGQSGGAARSSIFSPKTPSKIGHVPWRRVASQRGHPIGCRFRRGHRMSTVSSVVASCPPVPLWFLVAGGSSPVAWLLLVRGLGMGGEMGQSADRSVSDWPFCRSGGCNLDRLMSV